MHNEVMIEAKLSSKFQVQIQAGVHTLTSDLLESLGGDNTAPNPHEILEGALAACTIQTVQMYALRKGIAIESMSVEIHIPKEGPETEILRKIKIEGDFDESQRSRLFEISKKCPIHKLLESHITITSEIVS